MNKTKRVLSVVLAVLMLSSLIAALAIADGQHTVIINYVFENGKQAAPSWTATLAEGSNLEQTVTSPTVVGYEPDPATVDVTVNNITENKNYTVTYYPANVGFTVNHYLQNVADNNYTLDKTEHVDGFTESEVGGDLAKAYPGFAALLYNTKAKVAADGSTVVEIYYDRNYYMMSFNLDGGYGVEPIYAKYQTPVSVANPTKPGYTFSGWEPDVPETMPVNGGTHTAQWQKNNANYTVQYWQENADDDGYSYKESTTKSAPSGNAVSGTDDKTYAGFTYNAEKTDKDVIVKGDGSTVVNVYYKRNVYEVKFYKWQSGFLGFGGKWVEDASLRITAKYGAFIGDKWPGGGWYVDTNGDTAQSYLSIMPLGGMNFYGQQTGSYTATATYYVEVLPGESGTFVGGKYYKEHHKDTAKYSGSGLTVTNEDRYEIAGYTCNEAISTKNKANYNGAKFYYDRNKYKLEFNDNFDHSVSDDMFFEQQLKESPKHKAGYKPAYPSGLEAGAYDFGGWYIDKSCTEQVNWEAKMPATNLIVYAKWAPKTHTVKAYLTKEAVGEGEPIYTNHVPHGTVMENTPAPPVNGSYVFVGWFYMDGNVERAFDFSMPVIKDLNLYAKWSSNTLVTYTIYYKSGDTEIAEPTTGSALAGTTLTFEAKTGDELNEDYQSGYFPNPGSHSLTMDINGNNEFTFVYVAKEKVGYTVRYLDKATGEPVVVNGVPTPDKTGETSDAIITEKFKVITGYMPDSYQKRLVLSADPEKNVITFWYTKDELHAPVQIVHWIQNIAGEGYTEYQSSTNLNGEIGQTYTGTPLTIPGFTYNEKKSNASGELTAEGLELNLYYDRVKYSYTVRYVDAADNNKDIDPEANVTGEGLFGAQVIGSQKEFNGYMPADNEPKQKSIIIGTGTNTNEIIFYYYPCYYIGHVRSGSLNNTDTIRLTGSKANLTAAVTPGYLYGGTFDNVDCTTVHDFGEENAINFTPVKGEKYYIWEVSETYLKPRTYAIWRHDPNNNGRLNVVGLYLMTHADRLNYQFVGFEIVGENATFANKEVYEVVNAKKGDTLYQQIYVNLQGEMAVSNAEVAVTDRKDGYIAMHKLSEGQFATFVDKGLTFQPYWVTLDGIIVRGVNSRECRYKGLDNRDITVNNKDRIGSSVSNFATPSQQTVEAVSYYAFEAADVEVATPDVPETPEIPEVPEAPEMTLNSDAMYLRAQYTYEMMTNTVKFISAIDVNECTEYGFVINGEVVKCEEAAETVDGYDANYLFGGSVNGAMLMSCNMLLDGLVDGMTLNVTPYYVALDGTTVVYGETRTLVYRQWVGLEG